MTQSDIKILKELRATENELLNLAAHFESYRNAMESNDLARAKEALGEIEQYIEPTWGNIVVDCPTLPEDEG